MTHPSVNSIVERLRSRLNRDRRGNFDPELGLRIGPGMYEELAEAAAEIERLTREVDLLGKLAAPPDTVRFFETTHNIQSAAEEFRKRALTAESSLSRIKEETIEALQQIETVCIDNAGEPCRHDLALKFVGGIAAKAIRSLDRNCSGKTAESGHSAPTRERD